MVAERAASAGLDLKGCRVLVLGAGLTGLSAARWLVRHGARVRVADTRDAPPMAQRLRRELPVVELHTGPYQARSFAGIDRLVVSPGVPLSEPLIQRALAAGVPVAGDVELFARALALGAPMPKLIAITGSNGKSTVTQMAGAMVRAAGMETEVAGNIGLPVLDALTLHEKAGGPDAYVLELSSFQLETTSSLKPDAATVLNLSEDHLDRYAGMEEYAAAKARIFADQGLQVLNRDDAASLAMARPGRRVVTFGLDAPPGSEDYGIVTHDGRDWLVRGETPLLPAGELQVPGRHNAANALAALALTRAIGVADRPAAEALRRFTGLPHRVQSVAEIGGVGFYDDSKGTNVGSTVAALEGMGRKIVLIAGGDGKNQDFSPLKQPVARNARAAVLIGRDAARIARAIEGSGVPFSFAASMEDAVRQAFAAAQPGDAVLLSPACASFDMFRNYEHRGEVFVAAVRALEGRQ